MLAKIIKYKDYNGIEREDTYHFNLSQEELLNMNFGVPGGMGPSLQKIVDQADINGAKIMKFVSDVIEKSYGELSEDGKYFMKYDLDGHSLGKVFLQSAAYDALFEELLSSSDSVWNFMYGIVPADIAEQIKSDKQNEIEVSTANPAT